mgnify:CR=1 FL=1
MNLKNYLKSRRINADVEFDSRFNMYNIHLETIHKNPHQLIRKKRQISIDAGAIENDFSLIAATILVVQKFERQFEHGYGSCCIKVMDNSSISVTLNFDTDTNDTTVYLSSGTELGIDILDPNALLEMHFTRQVTLSRENLDGKLRQEVDKLINDVKTYCK